MGHTSKVSENMVFAYDDIIEKIIIILGQEGAVRPR